MGLVIPLYSSRWFASRRAKPGSGGECGVVSEDALFGWGHEAKDRVPVCLFGELRERRAPLRVEERRGDRRRAQIGPQNRSRLGRSEFLDFEAFCLVGAGQLDPACRPCVLDPFPLAVRRDEPALAVEEDERDRSRVALPASPSDDREDVRASAGEPQPREGSDDEVEEPPQRALAVRGGHGGQLSRQAGLWEWAEC